MTDLETRESLTRFDPAYAKPSVVDLLLNDDLRRLRDFISADPFGSHVFPGVLENYSEEKYLEDMHRSLASAPEFHLWGTIPLCNYRCKFCQFAVIVRHHNEEKGLAQSSDWVEMNKKEAKLLIEKVPQIAKTPVGEFNLFGGTPTQLPDSALSDLIGFYLDTFNFLPSSSVRVEGSREHDNEETATA
ncbi:MAG: hypothetical protein IPJ88_10895 [Myxococcales bacterium]|nr:MAG: hypothetical protein IPJ88_10895 [Myxococcales bacterium]